MCEREREGEQERESERERESPKDAFVALPTLLLPFRSAPYQRFSGFCMLNLSLASLFFFRMESQSGPHFHSIPAPYASNSGNQGMWLPVLTSGSWFGDGWIRIG